MRDSHQNPPDSAPKFRRRATASRNADEIGSFRYSGNRRPIAKGERKGTKSPGAAPKVPEFLPESSPPVRAELIGSNVCIAGDITVTGNAPVLTLCRALIEASYDPAVPLHVYRGGTLCLIARSIEDGAGLGVRDDNRGTPRFIRYRPGPTERAAGACGEAPPAA